MPAYWRVPAAMTLADAHGAEPASRGNPKLGSSLNQLLGTYQRERLSGARSFAERHMMALDEGRVQVVVVAVDEEMDALRRAVEVLGGEYQGHYGTLLQALVPIDALESAAARTDVQVVREPRRPMPDAPLQAGAQTTEGVAASNASAWHAEGWDGTGVRLAIIDSGFTGYSALLGADLPGSVGTYDWTAEGMAGSEHGTACAEVAYDMAPGATIDLHKVGTEVELGNAIDQAIADGVDVASMSLGWFLNGPGDGTGSLADIIADARANGIFFAKSAGNYAESSWSGSYVNYNPGTHDYHAWDGANQWWNWIGPGGGSCYVLPASFPIWGSLHWDDWAAVSQDHDLHLYRWPGGGTTLYRVWSSTDPQNGGAGQRPEEEVRYLAAGGNCYAFVVERVDATRDVCLGLTTPMGHLDQWTPQRSLGFPADSPDAITVGAVDVAGYSLEPYSSQGPTFGPGGACGGGSTKPDIAGYANVSTVSYGPGDFAGTSAATPHVAGAAALVKQVHPAYGVSQLQSYLESSAIDLGALGKDNLYGAGRLYLPSENWPPYTPGNPSPADEATGVSTTIDLSWTGGDPDSGDTVTYDVYFGISDPPTTLLCDDVSSTTCDPGTLSYDTPYYWYVVAADNHGASTTGPTWDFATGPVVYLPVVLRGYPPRAERAYPGLDASILPAVPK